MSSSPAIGKTSWPKRKTSLTGALFWSFVAVPELERAALINLLDRAGEAGIVGNINFA